MKKVLLIVAAVVFAYLLFNRIDFISSIIPGWHTTIYPFWLIIAFLLLFFGFIYLIYRIVRMLLQYIVRSKK